MVDPTANFHWSSQGWLVTGAQSGEPNCDWLMSVWWADSGEAWLVEEALQQGRLVEEV